jgi:hypothetical protein
MPVSDQNAGKGDYLESEIRKKDPLKKGPRLKAEGKAASTQRAEILEPTTRVYKAPPPIPEFPITPLPDPGCLIK